MSAIQVVHWAPATAMYGDEVDKTKEKFCTGPGLLLFPYGRHMSRARAAARVSDTPFLSRLHIARSHR